MPPKDDQGLKILFPEGVSAVPEDIGKKLDACMAEARAIIDAASTKHVTKFGGSISFEYRSSGPRDILTEEQRAQSLFFITRYEHLPVVDSISLEKEAGSFHLSSSDHIRHALNEYRTMLMNKTDATYYWNVNSTIRQALLNQDETKDMRLIVQHTVDGDVSRRFADCMRERMKGLDELLRLSDFDYLYNGILQHSDSRFTERFWKEYSSGALNYIYIKHVALLPYIRECLRWHYTILHALTFPKLGPL